MRNTKVGEISAIKKRMFSFLIILCLVVKTLAALSVIHALLILVRSGNPYRLGNRLHRILLIVNQLTLG